MANHVHSRYNEGYLTYQNNTKHNRKILKLKDRYRKIWYGENPQLKLGTKNLIEHVRLLNKFNPGYILDYNLTDKEMIIDYEILPGKSMDTYYPYDGELKERAYDYCLRHLLSTWPYAFCEWNRWNVLIHNDSMCLIDWDSFHYASADFTLKNMINLLDNKFKKHF